MSNLSAIAAVVTTTELTKQIPVEVTVAQLDSEVEWINAFEFKKKLQNGEYAECHFAQKEIRFLGLFIGANSVRVDPDKTAALDNCATPYTTNDVQRFFGSVGYYRRLVEGFAALVLPLSNLSRGAEEWRWTPIEEGVFNAIKTKLLAAPVLRLPDIELPFQVTTDASKWCIGGVLSQVMEGFDHPVSFYSQKLSITESKWPAHEQELYAIKQCLERWR
ncbi:hypothetical protein PsorP6_004176 [Peronosclerospora sorghi]|uniref:Uncharacterized protein n=1 Tax=Peronosclerospora sorghi TaxID=230839 RepID=A0ACC0VLI9_9STRA|nr:hypothetical protein PsorP6_004176 [Peronosclerospora sorghi]